MKNTYQLILIILASIGLLTSCDNNYDPVEDLCIINKTEYVSMINSPNSGIVNQPLTITVQFQVINGCGQFGRFIETVDGNIRIIEVEAKYVGCYCTQDVPTLTQNYTFTPTVAGDYQIRFKSSETEFITANLSVN